MSLQIKDFARTDIKSERIHNSEESEDDEISYLPAPSSGKILIYNYNYVQIIFLPNNTYANFLAIIPFSRCFYWISTKKCSLIDVNKSRNLTFSVCFHIYLYCKNLLEWDQQWFCSFAVFSCAFRFFYFSFWTKTKQGMNSSQERREEEVHKYFRDFQQMVRGMKKE